MKNLALHVLDIVQNSITAGAANICVTMEEHTKRNYFLIRVEDDGCGMDAETLQKVTDPYYTSRTTRKVGLGIPLFKQQAEGAGGYLRINSQPGKGTMLEALFVHDHIDRPALGDMGGVFSLLIGSNPQIHFRYEHIKEEKKYVADTREIHEVLDGIPVSDPSIIRFIREMVKENLTAINAG